VSGYFTNRANQDYSASSNTWQKGGFSNNAVATGSSVQGTPGHNQTKGQLSQPDDTNISPDTSPPLAYNSYLPGGLIDPYPIISATPNNDYSLNMFNSRRESTPLSDEDFVVRRPVKSVDSSNARTMFEIATAHGRASHRESLENSESSSEYNSDEEPGTDRQDEEPGQNDSDSSSQEESIRNDE
jgi:hypothetical protein